MYEKQIKAYEVQLNVDKSQIEMFEEKQEKYRQIHIVLKNVLNTQKNNTIIIVDSINGLELVKNNWNPRDKI